MRSFLQLLLFLFLMYFSNDAIAQDNTENRNSIDISYVFFRFPYLQQIELYDREFGSNTLIKYPPTPLSYAISYERRYSELKLASKHTFAYFKRVHEYDYENYFKLKLFKTSSIVLTNTLLFEHEYYDRLFICTGLSFEFRILDDWLIDQDGNSSSEWEDEYSIGFDNSIRLMLSRNLSVFSSFGFYRVIHSNYGRFKYLIQWPFDLNYGYYFHSAWHFGVGYSF
jgi:hypothetical protein